MKPVDGPGEEEPQERLELMRPGEVQRWLKVSRSWLYEAAREGLLPSIRLGPDGPVRFVRADVEQFIEAARAKWRLGDTRDDALRRAGDPAPPEAQPDDQNGTP